MKICIRDDDLCYWSNFDDFKALYDELDVPVSISMIPYAFANHGSVSIYSDNNPHNIPRLVTDNRVLCEGVKKGINNKQYEILLHGYTHEYKVTGDGGAIPELLWKDYDTIKKELACGKSILEKEFGVRIQVLVAPSQGINQKGIDAMSSLGMNLSGLAHGRGDRKRSFKLFLALIRRYTSRLLYGFALSPVIKYKNYKEQQVVPIMDLKKMIKYYKICKFHNWNYVIVTHYWQLIQSQELKHTLVQFIEHIKNKEKKSFSFVSECYK